MTPSQPATPAPTQRLFLLATLAIIGQVIFLASAWLLPLVSEYSLISDTISELALGRFGFVQTGAFVISGLGVLGLAYAIRRLTTGARGSLAGSLLLAVYGVGTVLAAVFPTDRIDSAADLQTMSATSLIHSLVALVSFFCVIVGMAVLSWTFRRTARWRSLTPWAALLAAAAALLLIVFLNEPQGPWAGIIQRGLVTVIAIWLIMAAWRARAIVAPA